jgi:DHA1 family multidrug resistance protein-like MFS transporter
MAVLTGGSDLSASEARRVFGRLCAIGFLAYGSYAICRTPLLPLLATDLGADARMVGFIMGASTLSGVALKLPAGAWSDVLGRRRLLLLGALVFAILPFGYLGVASLGVLIALRFAHGSATAIFGPVASATLSDVAPAARRATWLSTYSMCQGVGQALGAVTAGYLVAEGRYDAAFVTAGLVALMTPFLTGGWSSLTEPTIPDAPYARFFQAIAEVARHPLILLTSVAQATQFLMNGTLNAFLPLFAREVIGMSAAGIGWLFALQTATTLAARPVMGMLSDRMGRRDVIVAGLATCSGAVLLISIASGVAVVAAGVVAYAIGVAVTTAAASAFITDVSRRERYGTAHGVFGTIYDVGDALGPILAGVLVAAVGYPRTVQVMAAVALAGAAAFRIGSARARR